MCRSLGLLTITFISTALLFSFVPPAPAQNIEGKWGFGIRAGFSDSTQDLANSVLFAGDTLEADTGPLVSGNILYGLNKNISVGLNVEWETHSTDLDLSVVGLASVDIGDVQTISIMPFVEARYPMGAFVPYGTLGVGININSFDEDPIIAPLQIEPDNTFALKVGGGADYFVTPELALNGELGWKLNSGDTELSALGVSVTGDSDASAISFIAGVRYYF